jgi:Uma2 family endonuclease
MVAVQSKPLTFEAFLVQYGDDDRYELIDGELFDLEPTGPHEEVAAFVARKINVQIDTLDLPWFIPQRCLIKPLGSTRSARPHDRTPLATRTRHHPRHQHQIRRRSRQ